MLAFVLCVVLLLYVQYTGLLLVVSLGIITLYLLWRNAENCRPVSFAIAFGVIFLLFTPWLQTFLLHLHTGTPWDDKHPWLMRPLLLFKNIMGTFPLSTRGQKFWLLFVLLGLAVEAKELFFLTDRSLSRFCTPPKASKVTVIGCFILPSAMLAVLSYGGGRYITPFAPFVWVLFSSWLVALFQYTNRCWTSQGYRFSRQLAFVFLILLLVLPSSRYALSLGNYDKSGIRSLAADFQGKHQEKTIYLLSPDFFGPTFGYYFAQLPVEFHGFGRWHHPEIFSPQGYAELWNSPTLISDTEQHIQDMVKQGYQRLALIQHSGTMTDRGSMKYSRVNQFFSRLRQTYPLVQETDYPGSEESVTLYLFSIIDKN